MKFLILLNFFLCCCCWRKFLLSWPQLFTSCHRQQRPSSAFVLLLSSFQQWREPKKLKLNQIYCNGKFHSPPWRPENSTMERIAQCKSVRMDGTMSFWSKLYMCVFFIQCNTKEPRRRQRRRCWLCSGGMRSWEFSTTSKKGKFQMHKNFIILSEARFQHRKRILVAWQREREAKNCHHPSMLPTITANLQSAHIYSSSSIVRTADDDCQ